jgi:hypothetical protein
VLNPAPVMPTEPLQPSNPVPPDAEHPDAEALVHVSTAAAPTCTVEGTAANALIEAAGGTAFVTLTVTDFGVPIPPGPVQSSVYVNEPAVAKGPMLVPALESGSLPFHPSVPEPPLAVQAVALLLDQMSTLP